MTDSVFIFCSKYLFIFLFLIAGAFFLKQPRKVQIEMVIFGLSIALLSYIFALVAGLIYFDPRPFVEGHFKPLIDHDTENGFPSDHVLLTSCVACVIFLFNKTWGILLWLITVLIAIARVYVGVHHPVDVVASGLITILVTLIFYRLYSKWLVYRWVNFLQAKISFLR
jgi:undecaprenyl-diphosphatase